MVEELIRKGIYLVISVIIIIGGWVGISYYQKSQVNSQKAPVNNINITTPTPNVEVKNIIDNISPWKKPPKYVAYTEEEVKNFKDENLILSPEINAWFQQAKKYPYKPYNAIFHGTPMTGKTSLARKLAREAGLPFVAVKGDDLQDRLYEQRTIKDKFEALLEDLKINPKTADKKYILFIDEANHVGDKLKFVKDMLAGVDDKALPDNLWIFATNYIEEIDKALYLNKERLRYKLDFSWNKKIFLDYLLRNNVFDLLNRQYRTTELGDNKFIYPHNFQNPERWVDSLLRCGSKYHEIYNKFNFETLQILKTKSAEFISYFNRIVSVSPTPCCPQIIISEWKSAINSIFPQVSKLETILNPTSYGGYWGYKNNVFRANYNIFPHDQLISATFEYCLDLFWKAYDTENNLDGQWGLVNQTNFLLWAKSKGYTFTDLGINIYNDPDKSIYVAQFSMNKILKTL